MVTTFKAAVTKYLRAGSAAHGTVAEYQTTLTKWKEWGRSVPLEQLGRTEIRGFLEWVFERAVTEHGKNPGRTANKAREHLRESLHGRGSRISLRLSLAFRSRDRNAMSQVDIV